MAINVGSRVYLNCSILPFVVLDIAGQKARIWWVDDKGTNKIEMYVPLTSLKETKPTGL